MIQESYVSFEQAKALKELGFHELVYTEHHSCYEGNSIWRHHKPKDFNDKEYSGLNTQWYSMPTLPLVQKWLIEEKLMCICVEPKSTNQEKFTSYWFSLWCEDNFDEANGDYDTYEEALSAGIDKCIELLKK